MLKQLSDYASNSCEAALLKPNKTVLVYSLHIGNALYRGESRKAALMAANMVCFGIMAFLWNRNEGGK